MKVIDLFAGAGGLSEGFRQAGGYDIVAHVEMDTNASYTLKTREVYYYLKEHKKLHIYENYLMGKLSRDELYSNVPSKVLDSVINTEISDKTINEIFDKIDKLLGNERVEVIIGGPPCQAYSLAGRSRDPNRMINDPRNFLYKQYIKFLEKYKPNIFVFENVRGILSAQNGGIFKSIQDEMKQVGYEIEYRILNAKDFGVAQSRNRVILVGWRMGISLTYPDFKIMSNGMTVRKLFEDLPKLNAGQILDNGYHYLKLENEKNSIVKKYYRKGNWNILTQHISRPNNSQDLKIYKLCVDKWNKEGKKLKYNELPVALRSHSNTQSFLDRFNVVPYDDVSHTIVAHISKDGHYYIHPDIDQNRSLTIREAARIQSFPDDYYFECSRTAAFKQIGNAVPPLMAMYMAQSLKRYI